MSTIGVASFFKGDSNDEKKSDFQYTLEREVLAGDVLIPRGESQAFGDAHSRFLNQLTMLKQYNPQMVENIGRVCAAQVHRCFLHKMNQDSRLFFVEGCEWDWGKKSRSGARIMQQMYQNVVPSVFKSELAYPTIEPFSARTLEEWQKLRDIAERERLAGMDGITSGYHVRRTAAIGKEVFRKMPETPVRVFSTAQIADALDAKAQREPEDRFMVDVIRASEPSPEREYQEQSMERILSVLMRVRQLTGLDPEGWILAMKKGRRRCKPEEQAS